ncbi:MAG: gliding motility-associated C-terminal domain-containing protein [Bacteroidota bacterium]
MINNIYLLINNIKNTKYPLQWAWLFIVFFKVNSLFAFQMPTGIKFIENKGQWESEVLYKADIPGGHLFISNNCITYYLVDKLAVHDHQHGKGIKSGNAQVYKIFFDGNNPTLVTHEANFPNKERYNFYKGEQSKWRSGVRAYNQVILKNVFEGIDLEINSYGMQVKTTFIVSPNANPNDIKLRYEGADELKLIDEDINVSTSLGDIIEKKPESFQRLDKTILKIYSAYELNKNVITYKLGEYEKGRELIIDPTWIFGTYVGSPADNFGFCSTFDRYGNAYAGGTVYGANFPRTTGRFQASFQGGNSAGNEYGRDCIIAKFSPDGTDMLWATYLGGTNNEQPHSMTTNTIGDLYIMGSTYSSNFPVSTVAYDKTFNGVCDIFVSKLSQDGTVLIASTFLGGAGKDGITGFEEIGYPTNNGILCYNYADWYRGEIIADQFGSIYIASVTESNLFPVPNAFQPGFGGGITDGVLAKFNDSLSRLNFSTYVGGSGDDACYALITDPLSNNLYVTGGTTSANLPGASAPFTYKGGVDGYILKTNTSGSSSPRTVYIGTNVYDQTYLIQQNTDGDVFAIGQTAGNIPVTPGIYSVPGAKHFIKSFDRGLTTEKLSTIFGKPATFPSLSPTAFVIDKCNKLYFSGWGGTVNLFNNTDLSNTAGLPVTPNAFQKTTDGSDFYLMILGAGLKDLTYASFYGGSQSSEHVDGGTSHFDKNFIIYQTVCAGCWGNSDFPTTGDAWSNVNPGRNAKFNAAGCNIGVFKFNLDASIYKPEVRDTLIEIDAGDTLNLLINAIDKDNDSILVTATGAILAPGTNPALFEIVSRSKGLTQMRLKWATLCKNISTDTFIVDLDLIDDACPVSKTGTGKIKILVKSPKSVTPFPACLSSINDNTVRLTWDSATSKPKRFGYLQIYKSVNNGPYSLIDTVANWQVNKRIDNNALNHKIIQTKYYLVSVNNCGTVGDSSRVIGSVYEGDTILLPGFTEVGDTLLTVIKTESIGTSFVLKDTESKDSSYITVSGDLLSNNLATITTEDGLGSGKVNILVKTDCNSALKTWNLYVKIRDNQCPQPREKTKHIQVQIIPMPPIQMPELVCPLRLNNDRLRLALPLPTTNKYYKEFALIKYNRNVFMGKVNMYNNLLADTFYIDEDAVDNANKNYCYQTIAYNICGEIMDSSAKVCVRNESGVTPDKLKWYTVTVVDDKEIKLVWNKSPNEAIRFQNYVIYKMQDRNGKLFNNLTSVISINDTTYTDTDVKVDDHSYCYKVTNTNECGVESINNDTACSILLTGSSEKLAHNLQWQNYNYWPLGAQKYELQKANVYNTTFNNILPNNNKGLAYLDKVFDYQVGLYYYKTVASQNPNEGNAFSESNTIELIQAPYVFAPNAYTPNGDNLNDIWIPQHAFVRDYNLKIFNRWGQLIFETNDKNKGFNLSTSSGLIANDVYVYIINYTGWNEESNTLKGNFTVLK